MQRVDAELDRFQIVKRREAVVAVRVKFQWDGADVPLNERNERARAIGS